MIRDAVEGDSQAIAEIYNAYIENTAISFEERPVAGVDIRRTNRSPRNVAASTAVPRGSRSAHRAASPTSTPSVMQQLFRL